VENAIIHGFEKKRGNGRISISSVCKDKLIVLEVVDDGMGIAPEILRNILSGPEGYTQGNNNGHTKVGINSVDKRIKILYGEEYGVKIHSEEGKGTEVTITFPLEFEDEEGSVKDSAGDRLSN
jgi:sensor histidine kinase YesM